MNITKELIVKDPIQALEIMSSAYTDEAIAKLSADYLPLVIKGQDDKPGFDTVHAARMDIKGRRVSVTKVGKELRDVASAEVKEYCAKVLKVERHIVSALEPIEAHLEAEENRITEEKARTKREAAEAEERRIQARQNRLFDLGMTSVRGVYSVLSFSITHELLVTATDEQLDAYCEKVAAGVKADAEYKAELKRLEEIEKKRLQEIADQQAAERKKLDDEKAALEAEKKRIKDAEDAKEAEEKRQKEIKEAEERAAAKAIQDEKDRLEKRQKNLQRQEARRPDKEKLEHLGLAIAGMVFPVMKTEEGQEILDWFGPEILKLVKELKRKAEAL
jgi:DNA repair exonuclease SbcCD ATPase subunit